jgi:hypothetical protein
MSSEGTFDVDAILDKETLSTLSVGTQKDEIVSLRNRLNMWHENCRDLFVDLREVNFVCTPDDSYIEFTNTSFYGKRLYFKIDPQNPKDAKVILATQQFCKFLGVPFGFFTSNRPSLKMNIVKTWQAGLSATESKAQAIMKIRESKDCTIIRAITPTSKCSIPLHELISIILNTIEIPVKMEFVYGDEKDDPVMHARFLFEKEYKILGEKETVCLGFSLIASELDASSLVIDVLVHDKVHATSYIASYGGDPFFKSKYEGIKASQIKDVFPKMLNRIDAEAAEMLANITSITLEACDFCPEPEALRLMRAKGFSSKIKKAVFHQISECEKQITNPWELARHVGLVAKDFDAMKRLDIERAIGKYLGLIYGKE